MLALQFYVSQLTLTTKVICPQYDFSISQRTNHCIKL
jgi:hypothetical protein